MNIASPTPGHWVSDELRIEVDTDVTGEWQVVSAELRAWREGSHPLERYEVAVPLDEGDHIALRALLRTMCNRIRGQDRTQGFISLPGATVVMSNVARHV